MGGCGRSVSWAAACAAGAGGGYARAEHVPEGVVLLDDLDRRGVRDLGVLGQLDAGLVQPGLGDGGRG